MTNEEARMEEAARRVEAASSEIKCVVPGKERVVAYRSIYQEGLSPAEAGDRIAVMRSLEYLDDSLGELVM